MFQHIKQFVASKIEIMAGVLALLLLVGMVILAVRGQDHYEMNQAESVRLVRALDTALAVRQQAEQATQNYNQVMADVRKAHGWPDDLVFDGTEWKHAPKPPEPAKPEPAQSKK